LAGRHGGRTLSDATATRGDENGVRGPRSAIRQHDHRRDSPCWAVRSTCRRTLAHAGGAVGEQLTAYRALVKALGEASTDPKGTSALEALEPLLFNNMMLVLDRHLVHRLRMVTGKDGDALNEVELLAHSLIHNDAVLRATTSSGTRPRSRSSSSGSATRSG